MNASPSPFRDMWMLKDNLEFLNHGAFGACPIAVLEQQAVWRDKLETQPLSFLVRALEPLLDASRVRLATTLGGDPANMVFVQNATAGVNTVLRSLSFSPGDAILLTNHGYNACTNAARFVGDQWGMQIDVANVPAPLNNSDDCLGAVLEKVTAQTRLAIIDHVTSPTGIVFPIESIVRELKSRGVSVLVDGAHAPGMVSVDLKKLGADFYTGNCHKWLCAPKGAAFLYIDPIHHDRIRPLSISHGANSRRTDRSRLHLEFDWQGTFDPTPWICIRDALDFVENLVPGGLNEVMRRNRALTLKARQLFMDVAGLTPLAGSENLVGSLAAFQLKDCATGKESLSPFGIDWLQDRLLSEYNIEVPVFAWPASPKRVIRFACQMYNDISQYERLARLLNKLG